ncbi:MAG: anthranilate phosphoribosyltransferase [Candidatus Methanosuratus sp.]|nr:anthranilate phosphoribosyltransferase [Candidatus Methanosuratincola sp.]
MDDTTIKNVMKKLTTFHNLTDEEAYNTIMELSKGTLTDSQIAGFQVAMLMKGPTISEIASMAKAMKDVAKPVRPKISGRLTDTCGTGGGVPTYNISTANAVVTAAGGVYVAKHGSRSIAGRSGSADVLEALGIKISLTPEQAEKLIEEIGICFLNASDFHPVMGRVWKPESELGIKTIFFTIMGPLINPADAKAHLLGVYKPDLVQMVAEILARMDFARALVVHGVDGFDEISLTGKTLVAEVNGTNIERYELTPEEFGLERCHPEALSGGTPEDNAQIIRNIFSGKEKGPRRDVLLMNAAGSLYVGGMASSFRDGIELARNIIDEGKAEKKLEEFIRASNEVDA